MRECGSAPGTVIYPGVYLGRGVQVGQQCVLHANAVVREGCVLGDRVVLQPGAVIGSDGFGYARDGARQVRFPQVGIVVLEDDVEVGACTTVDRAALGETRIGRGTKIDNQVQVGHNVRVGQDCTLVSQVGISGSSTLGDRVILAGQVGVVGHLSLGDGVIVGAQSGVPGDLPPGAVVTGSPAIPHQEFLRMVCSPAEVAGDARETPGAGKAVGGTRDGKTRLRGGGRHRGESMIDIQGIMKCLPHRYPFLLVDRVLELHPGEGIHAVKNITFNEPCFTGHFPGQPVFPGVSDHRGPGPGRRHLRDS